MTFMGDSRGWLADFLGQPGRLVIVCLGNEFRADDGAGIEVARRLMEARLGGVAVVEAGRRLLGHLPDIEEAGPSRLLFIDVADLGMEPGSIAALEWEQILERNISTHENNLNLVMPYLWQRFPELKVLFVGIQFGSMEMCEELSLTDEIKRAIEELVECITRSLSTS